MSHEAVARRYARAVFELAKEAGTLDQTVKELQGFAALYADSEELRQLDQLPGLGDKERAKIVGEIGRKLGSGDLVTRTVTMLCARKRMAILPDLVLLLSEQSDAQQGVLRAHVESARELGSSYVAELQRAIERATGKKAVITTAVDPTLVAGVVTTIGDRVIDGSIRGKLDSLAASFRQG